MLKRQNGFKSAQRRSRLRFSPSMGLAFVAVFLLMSGSVVAASKLGKGSVSTREIKDRTVAAKDVKRDALTGKEINESSLGVVPRAQSASTASSATTAQAATAAQTAGTARSADRASDADRLGGRSPSEFASSSETFTIAVKISAGASRVLVERDGVRLVARCEADKAAQIDGNPVQADVLTIYAESTIDGATLSAQGTPGSPTLLDGSGSNRLGPGTSEQNRIAFRAAVAVGGRVMRVSEKPTVLTSEGGTTIFFGVGSSIRATLGLHGALCTVTAPVQISRLN